ERRRVFEDPCTGFYFNPRSHEGSDAGLDDKQPDAMISIHAPTRGATKETLTATLTLNYFNPRSHEGSDYDLLHSSFRSHLFQSTLPRGERLVRFAKRTFILRFQSTLPRAERH